MVADSATILISNESNSKIELKANANVDAAKFDIADASFEFGAVVSKGMETQIEAQKGLTPLFKVMGTRTPFLGKTSFKTLEVEKDTTSDLKSIDLLTPSNADTEFKDKISFASLDFEPGIRFDERCVLDLAKSVILIPILKHVVN